MSSLLTKFHKDLGEDLQGKPEKILERIKEIITHPSFSDIPDETAEFLWTKIQSSATSSFDPVLAKGLFLMLELLKKKPNLLNCKKEDLQSTVLYCFKKNRFQKEAGNLFARFIFPAFSDSTENLQKLVQQHVPISADSVYFFDFLLNLPNVRSSISQELGDRMIRSCSHIQGAFHSMLTIPSISIGKAQELLLADTSCIFSRSISCLAQRPEFLTPEVLDHIVTRFIASPGRFFLYKSFPIDFISQENFWKLKFSQGTLARLIHILLTMASPGFMLAQFPHEFPFSGPDLSKAQRTFIALLGKTLPQVEDVLKQEKEIQFLNAIFHQLPREISASIEKALRAPEVRKAQKKAFLMGLANPGPGIVQRNPL